MQNGLEWIAGELGLLIAIGWGIENKIKRLSEMLSTRLQAIEAHTYRIPVDPNDRPFSN